MPYRVFRMLRMCDNKLLVLSQCKIEMISSIAVLWHAQRNWGIESNLAGPFWFKSRLATPTFKYVVTNRGRTKRPFLFLFFQAAKENSKTLSHLSPSHTIYRIQHRSEQTKKNKKRNNLLKVVRPHRWKTSTFT